MKSPKCPSHFLTFPVSHFRLYLVSALLALAPGLCDAADPVIETFQKALFEEEANQNYEAAITAYKEVVGKLDEQRKLAATALFRLGECYRKLGRTNEALAQYRRVVQEYPDQSRLVELSRVQSGGAAGNSSASSPSSDLPPADRAKLKALLQQELGIAEKFLTQQKERIQAGLMPVGGEVRFQRDVLGLRRQLLAVDGLTESAERAQWRSWLQEEIGLAEKAVQREQITVDKGLSGAGEVARLQREVLGLKRELILFEASASPSAPQHQPFASSTRLPGGLERAEGAAVSDEEEKEIRRIRALIQDSPDLINARNNAGQAPLHSASGAGYSRVVRFLLESGADVNLKTGGASGGQTALHSACRSGHKSVVDLLLDAKADVGVRDATGNTALHLASLHGYRLIVDRLLGASVPVNSRNNYGMTPLHYAVAYGHQSVVELLFKKGADLNLPTTSRLPPGQAPEIFEGYAPIHTAVAADQIALIRWLSTNGANVNAAAGRDRQTALHLAARNNNADAIRALARGGLELDAPDVNGQTPLFYAVGSGKLNAAEILLEAGANPNGRSLVNAPLLHAVRESEPILQLLLRYKPDLEVTNESGRTFLFHLIEQVVNGTNLIAQLLNAGANPNAALAGGYTPLHAAASRASPDIARMLLRQGAEVNALTRDGITPLYSARSANSPWRSTDRVEQTVALLLENGADETLQRRRSITVTRRTRGYESAIFLNGTNDFNRHSLFELITTLYQPGGFGRNLPFPEMTHLVVNRALGGGRTVETNLDVDARMALSGCQGDFWLEWGDVVEIPELDHPLPASWTGFQRDYADALRDCVSRKVAIVIKGRTNIYELKVGLNSGDQSTLFNLPFFRLNEVLRQSGLLLTSSDSTRVRVSRLDPLTGQAQHWTLDTTKLLGSNDLWLRDGDVIEVPDLPPGTRMAVEPVPPANRFPRPRPAQPVPLSPVIPPK